MTWIIGGATPTGQSFLIGDTRVSFADKSEADLVRKVYWLGRDIAGGFCGSVKIGFHLLSHLHLGLSSDDPTKAYIPEGAARQWSSAAAALFSKHDQKEQALGCSILLAAVSPHNNGPFPRTVLIRLESPRFEPERVGNFGSIQIGSGRDVDEYREWVEQYFADPRFVADFGGWGGSIGGILAMSVSDKIRETPRPGVSPHLHYVSCLRGSKSEGTSARHTFDDRSSNYEMPDVASDYQAFLDLAKRRGMAAAAAAA